MTVKGWKAKVYKNSAIGLILFSSVSVAAAQAKAATPLEQVSQVAAKVASQTCISKARVEPVQLPASLVKIAMPTLLDRSKQEVVKQGGTVVRGKAHKSPAGYWLVFRKGGELNFMGVQPLGSGYAVMGCQLREP